MSLTLDLAGGSERTQACIDEADGRAVDLTRVEFGQEVGDLRWGEHGSFDFLRRVQRLLSGQQIPQCAPGQVGRHGKRRVFGRQDGDGALARSSCRVDFFDAQTAVPLHPFSHRER